MHNKFALVLVCTLFSCLLSTLNVSAQSAASNQNLIYLECSKITPETYGAVLTRLKNDANLELGEVCVPAHVVTLRIKSGNNNASQLVESFKTKTNGIDLGEIKILPDFNDAKFMERCSAARYGR
jgi:hypothetical protein